VEVAVNLPTGASQIQFDYFSSISNALRINGGIITFLHIPGTINGATVSKSGSHLTASGSIESFSLIGTEFMVDNLVADLTADLAADYNNDLEVHAADYLWWRKNANNPSGYNS
jgi:sugar lactone lactonase YvrE